MIEFLYCMLPCVVACTLIFVAPLALIVFISSDISSLPGESNMTEKSEQKIEQFWRDAKHGDVARVMNREAVEARFRDRIDQEWKPGFLSGWSKIDKSDSIQWAASSGAFWRFCQVYDPPQWWLDKPDPGEGWRLLGKFPPEPKLATDEFFDPLFNTWTRTATTGETQSDGAWYRRRIEPNSPEKLDDSHSKDNIPTGWQKLPDDEPRLASDAYWSLSAKDWIIIGDARLEYANRDKWPAIRQNETQKTMQLVLWHQYRLPNGRSIKVTKEGFELL
jgi:hypothetical protein